MNNAQSYIIALIARERQIQGFGRPGLGQDAVRGRLQERRAGEFIAGPFLERHCAGLSRLGRHLDLYLVISIGKKLKGLNWQAACAVVRSVRTRVAASDNDLQNCNVASPEEPRPHASGPQRGMRPKSRSNEDGRHVLFLTLRHDLGRGVR